MSTTEFLKTLDYDQLQFCRDECEARIKAIEEEEKKVARRLLMAKLIMVGIEQRTT